MTKLSETKQIKYEWVDHSRREELIKRVRQGESIVSAAKDLNINYGNAKCIIRTQRRNRRKNKNGT